MFYFKGISHIKLKLPGVEPVGSLSFDNIKGNFFSKNTKRNRTRDSADSDLYTTTLLSDLLTKKLHIYVEISCILTDHGGSLVLHVLCYSLPPTPNTHRPPNHPHPPTPKSHTTPRSTNTQSYKYYSNDQLRYGNSNVIFQHFRRHCVIKLLVLHLKCFSLNKMNQFGLKEKSKLLFCIRAYSRAT